MLAPQLSLVLPLAEWTNFYVIVGTSAGALTGLTFVVMTITGDTRGAPDASRTRLTGLRAFITPTAVHFAAALWISGILCMPGHTVLSVAICMGATSVAGILYCLRVIHWMRSMRADYVPFVADWIWNAALPLAAYVVLLAASALLPGTPRPSLYGIAATALMLLFIGIHNAWDVVVWFTTERHAHPERRR
ncbi:MAG: hypothetical protein ACREUG_08950 [Steroidobacteraceae bacterium]